MPSVRRGPPAALALLLLYAVATTASPPDPAQPPPGAPAAPVSGDVPAAATMATADAPPFPLLHSATPAGFAAFSRAVSDRAPPALLMWDGPAIHALRHELRRGQRGSRSLTLMQRTALRHLSDLANDWVHRVEVDDVPLIVNKTAKPPPGASARHFTTLVPYAHSCAELPRDCVGYNQLPVNNDECDYATGLPWVICDDKLNHAARDTMTDRPRLDAMMHAVIRLSLAAYLLRDVRFASAAARMLDLWFVDERTAMLPSLEFAQGVPGVTNGKHSGCIDLSFIGRGFADAVLLLLQTPELHDARLWDARRDAALRAWCAAMAKEMISSEQLAPESRMRNNHGLFYDLTVLSLSALARPPSRTSLPPLVREMLSAHCNISNWSFCVRGRLADQVDSSGAQQHELDRRGFGHYVWYTMLAHSNLMLFARAGGALLPTKGSALLAIARWTRRHDGNATVFGQGDEWLAYGAQAYRVVARLTGDDWFESSACDMLRSMYSVANKTYHVWHDARVGMDVWNIALPPVPTHPQCDDVWAHMPVTVKLPPGALPLGAIAVHAAIVGCIVVLISASFIIVLRALRRKKA